MQWPSLPRYSPRLACGNDDLVIYEGRLLRHCGGGKFSMLRPLQTKERCDLLLRAGLVEDGEITVNEATRWIRPCAAIPTAIGMIEPLHYSYWWYPSRTDESEGLTLMELAQVMQDLGCQPPITWTARFPRPCGFMGGSSMCPTDGRSIRESVSDIATSANKPNHGQKAP